MEPAESKKKAKLDRCRVCGDAAFYSFFGTISCQACKMFFKRYGNRRDKMAACLYGGHCEIDVNTRHICSFCRLEKCLSSGMQKEKIRQTTNMKPTFKIKRQSSQIVPAIPSNSSSILLKAPDHLQEDQWCLLDKLTHIYNFSNITNCINHLNTVQPQTSHFSVHSTFSTATQNVFTAIYQTAGIICRALNDIRSLPTTDRSRLLSTAINNITCFLASYIFAQHNLYHNHLFVDHLVHLYGSSIVQYHYQTTLLAQFDDLIVFKLFVALFALSNVSRMNRFDVRQEFINPKSIMDIEHRYAEVTWKYLTHKYNRDEAMRRFMRMIRWLMALSLVVYHSQDVKKHMDDIEKTIEEVEMDLILDDMDEITD